nr:ribonuclease H-like domain-containing protein [Tanacetum cinerariifolium]
MDPYNHSTPISIKLPFLDTRKFEQWKFRIQQYLQHEHYSLWKFIEFGNSYKAPPKETTKDKGLAGEVYASIKKKGRIVAITAKDIKYDSAKELWEAVLKTFGGNEATKKTKKNQLKQQYGNFKAEGSETFEQTFNRLQAILNGSQIKYEDISQIDNDDDVEEIDIKWNLALLSMRANRKCRSPRSQDRWKRESYKKDPKVEEPAPKAMIAIDGIGWDWSYMVRKINLQRIILLWPMKKKYQQNMLEWLNLDKNGVEFNEYCAAAPPPAQVYSPPKKDLFWMGLPEFVDNTVTNYTRPTPSIDVSKCDNINDKGYWDSGCSRHMTGNISYLSKYEPFNRGYVSFGHGGGKITGKGSIKTGKLEFENVYFVEELK